MRNRNAPGFGGVRELMMGAPCSFEDPAITQKQAYDFAGGHEESIHNLAGVRYRGEMAAERGSKGRKEDAAVWPKFEEWDERRGGIIFREQLYLAGIKRTELFEGTIETTPADFRSLRTTGVTMEALLKTDAKTLERRVGHCKGSTDRYIIAAEAVSYWPRDWPPKNVQNEKAPANAEAIECRRRESKALLPVAFQWYRALAKTMQLERVA
jgi:hypothetical protein